jgi:hypothetical protein
MLDYCILKRFLYPTNNRVGCLTKLVWHEVAIYRSRDIEAEPLHFLTEVRRPKIRRDGLLDYAWESESQRYKKFYEGSMRRVTETQTLLRQIGVFDPTFPDVPPMMYRGLFTDSRADEARMKEKLAIINQFLAMQSISQVATIFPVTPKPALVKGSLAWS